MDDYTAPLGWKNTTMEALQMRLVSMDEHELVIEMPITDAARQPFGLLHGGVSMVLAESAASNHAAWGIDLSQRVPVGIEINGTHLRSASEGTVRAVARVLRRTRSLIFHEVTISHVETGHILSIGRVTNYYKPLKRDDPEAGGG